MTSPIQLPDTCDRYTPDAGAKGVLSLIEGLRRLHRRLVAMRTNYFPTTDDLIIELADAVQEMADTAESEILRANLPQTKEGA